MNSEYEGNTQRVIVEAYMKDAIAQFLLQLPFTFGELVFMIETPVGSGKFAYFSVNSSEAMKKALEETVLSCGVEVEEEECGE